MKNPLGKGEVNVVEIWENTGKERRKAGKCAESGKNEPGWKGERWKYVDW